jgi:phage terminase large subunit-like protein
VSNKLVAEMERRKRRRKLYNEYYRLYDHTKPFSPENQGVYEWAKRFHDAGADFQQRCLIAANRVGKTHTAGAEIACHVIGEYPDWWQGCRFSHPVRVWTGAVTNKASKEIIQEKLLGTVVADMKSPDFGTGWIPGDNILDIKVRQAGLGDVVDSIVVKHSSGGESHIGLLTYEQGRASWQGTSKDIIWFDEEPPGDVYTEGLTRVLDRNGIVMLTFTPLTGPTDVVIGFMNAKEGSGRFFLNVGWGDAPHLDEKAKTAIMESYAEHERDTRAKGTPMLGTGVVFPIDEAEITIDEMPKIQPWWRFINGVDFGIDHPAAGAFCVLDPSGSGTFYVYDGYRARGQTAVYHAAAIKKHGAWIPTAWPHDGLQKDKGSGIALKDQYRSHGVHMLKEHAHYKDERGNHVDPALIEMLEWMRTGRFKVVRSLSMWFEEKRMYRRDDGQVIKMKDDLISATRYAFMMRRHAIPKPSENQSVGSQAPSVPMLGKRRWARHNG